MREIKHMVFGHRRADVVKNEAGRARGGRQHRGGHGGAHLGLIMINEIMADPRMDPVGPLPPIPFTDVMRIE